jgi:hypothetical protein
VPTVVRLQVAIVVALGVLSVAGAGRAVGPPQPTRCARPGHGLDWTDDKRVNLAVTGLPATYPSHAVRVGSRFVFAVTGVLSHQAHLAVLDLRSGKLERPAGAMATDNHANNIVGGLVANATTVFVADSDDDNGTYTVSAYDVATGRRTGFTLPSDLGVGKLWAVAYADGHVLLSIVENNGNSRIDALDPQTGAYAWRDEGLHFVASTMLSDGSKVFVGVDEGDGSIPQFLAFDGATGTRLTNWGTAFRTATPENSSGVVALAGPAVEGVTEDRPGDQFFSRATGAPYTFPHLPAKARILYGLGHVMVGVSLEQTVVQERHHIPGTVAEDGAFDLTGKLIYTRCADVQTMTPVDDRHLLVEQPTSSNGKKWRLFELVRPTS